MLNSTEAGCAVVQLLPRVLKDRNIHAVHIYNASTVLNEVATAPIVKYIEENFPNVAISQPDQSTDATMLTEKFDIIFAPIVAFDANLNRIGMGSGWYDRFLARNLQALKIGIAYDESYVQKIESEPHDVRLDIIVTPKGLLYAH